MNVASTSFRSWLPRTLTVTFWPTVSVGSSGVHALVAGSNEPGISSLLSSSTLTLLNGVSSKVIFEKPVSGGGSLVIAPLGLSLVEPTTFASGSLGHLPVKSHVAGGGGCDGDGGGGEAGEGDGEGGGAGV